MKDKAYATLQFSGYSVAVAERPQKAPVHLVAVKSQPAKQSTSISSTSKLANDPKNWDEHWFGSYE